MIKKKGNFLKEGEKFKEFVKKEAIGTEISFYGGTRAGNSLNPGIYMSQEPDKGYKDNILKVTLKPENSRFKGSEKIGISYSKCKDIASLIDALAEFNKKRYGFDHLGDGLSTKSIIGRVKRHSVELKLEGLVILEELFLGPGLYQVDIPYDYCLTGIVVAYTMPIATCNDSICLPGVRFEAIGKGLDYLPLEYFKSWF